MSTDSQVKCCKENSNLLQIVDEVIASKQAVWLLYFLLPTQIIFCDDTTFELFIRNIPDLTTSWKNESHRSLWVISPRVLDDDVTTTYPHSQIVVFKRNQSVNDCRHPRLAGVSLLVGSKSEKPHENTHTHFYYCPFHSPHRFLTIQPLNNDKISAHVVLMKVSEWKKTHFWFTNWDFEALWIAKGADNHNIIVS